MVGSGAIFLSKLTTIIQLSVLCLHATVNAGEREDVRFCPDGARVDLNDAKRNDTGFFAEPGQFFPTDIVWETSGMLFGCICDIEPCILLCPSPSEKNSTEISGPRYSGNASVEIPSMRTTDSTHRDVGNPPESEDRFHVFVWDACEGDPASYFELGEDADTSDESHLLKENGSVYGFIRENTEALRHESKSYCLFQRTNHTGYSVRVCEPSIPFESASLTAEWQKSVNICAIVQHISMFVSVPFLIATIFVYSVLPELRNTHGITLRCHLYCLLVFFIIITVRNMMPSGKNTGIACLISGHAIYFSSLSSFLWLNVMCFDMWQRFRGYGISRSGGKLHNRKRFIWSSIYSWGIPTVLMAISIVLDCSAYFAEPMIAPDSQKEYCWFLNDIASILFFYLPVGVTIICNFCFFVATSIKLFNQQRNTHRELSRTDSQRHKTNEASLSLHVKLFVIMGLTWSMVIISDLWDVPTYFRSFAMAMNGLHGIPIFIIFICKRRIWRSLKKRFKYCRGSYEPDVLRSTENQKSSVFLSHNSAQTHG